MSVSWSGWNGRARIVTAGMEIDGGNVHQEKHMRLLSACIIACGHRQKSIGRCSETFSTLKITGASMPSAWRRKSAKSSPPRLRQRLASA